MTNIKEDFNQNKPLPPFSIRFTQEERQLLEHLAQGCSLGEYIRTNLFGEEIAIRRTKGRFPVEDEKALSKLIGVLGHSRISSNINQLAKAANSGSLPVNSETQQKLEDACKAIYWMRQQLIQSLGLKHK